MVSARWVASLMTASCMMVSITNTAMGATGTAAPDPIARAEAAFQSGDVRTGMDILDPYWRVLPADPARQAALADLFARYPSARIMALADLRRAAEGFADKAAALAAARQVARAKAFGLDGPAPTTPSSLDGLQRMIATRAAEQNRSGSVPWMLTDPYTEVPGLTTPEAETIILDRTLAHARATSSAEASDSIIAYFGRHADDAAMVERMRSLLPQLALTEKGQSEAFRILHPERHAIKMVLQGLFAASGFASSGNASPTYRRRESLEDLEDRLERQERDFATRMRQEEDARRRAEERHRREIDDLNRRQAALEQVRRYNEEQQRRINEPPRPPATPWKAH